MRFTHVILGAALCLSLSAQAETDNQSTEAIEAAAQQLIAEAADAGTIVATAKDAATIEAAANAENNAPKAELKESEIPIVMSDTKAAKSEGGMAWRLIASLLIIAVVAGGMIFAGKRYARQKDKGGQKARIEILHQYHLGPKKSLALIRVSGEAILIGVTDQNINLLKQVTLIDDELENVLGKDFNNFLEDEFSVEDVRNAISPRI